MYNKDLAKQKGAPIASPLPIQSPVQVENLDADVVPVTRRARENSEDTDHVE